MAFADRVTVFRGGQVTGERDTPHTNPQELADLMVGRKVALSLTLPPGKPAAEPALEVEQLSLAAAKTGRHRLAAINLVLRRGEIVGIAGVEGNGQGELLRALLQPRERRYRTAGRIRFLGQDVTRWRDRQDSGPGCGGNSGRPVAQRSAAESAIGREFPFGIAPTR